jgi:hypothetical protein
VGDEGGGGKVRKRGGEIRRDGLIVRSEDAEMLVGEG